jgi:HEAT repeat protein
MTLKEANYPLDARGVPELRYFTDSLDYYIQMYEQHLGTLQGKKGVGFEPELAFSRRSYAMWGLISKGAAAAPYALSLLRHSEPEAREDGPAILAEIGKDERVVDQLIASLESETDRTATDSLILALGRLKNRKAIPVLAAIIRDEAQDADTSWTAVESLGIIVRKRFLHQEDPVQAARAWLEKHTAASG